MWYKDDKSRRILINHEIFNQLLISWSSVPVLWVLPMSPIISCATRCISLRFGHSVIGPVHPRYWAISCLGAYAHILHWPGRLLLYSHSWGFSLNFVILTEWYSLAIQFKGDSSQFLPVFYHYILFLSWRENKA